MFTKAHLEQFRFELHQILETLHGECRLTGRDSTGTSECTLEIRATDMSGHFRLAVEITDRDQGEGTNHHIHRVQTGFQMDSSGVSRAQAELGNLMDYLVNSTAGVKPSAPPQPRDPTWPGLEWRFLVRDWVNPSREVYHLTGDGLTWFDELVVGDRFHMEWMNGRHWWMRLGDAMINVTIPKGHPPIISIERDNYYDRPSPEEEATHLENGDVNSDPYGPDLDDE